MNISIYEYVFIQTMCIYIKSHLLLVKLKEWQGSKVEVGEQFRSYLKNVEKME